MKRIFILIIIALINKSEIMSQNNRHLIDSTIELIRNNRDTIGDFVIGRCTKIVAENVMLITYREDTLISDSVKFELIFLMLLNQDLSSRNYRAVLFDRILKHDSIVLAKPLFAIPFLFCHYCQYTNVLINLFLDSNFSTLDYSCLPRELVKLYEVFTISMKTVDLKKSEDSYLTLNVRTVTFTKKLNEYLNSKYQF